FPGPCSLFLRFLGRRRFRFFLLAIAAFVVGQSEERGDRLAGSRLLTLFFELRLTFNGEPRERDRFQSRVRDWFVRNLANAIRAELDPLQRLIDLVKRVLFL